MNVAIFASAFYPHAGGVEELVRQLAHAYRVQGHEVIILTNRWPRTLPAFEEYEGIPVYRLAFRVPEGSFKAHLSYRLTHGAICRQTLSILRKRQINVLHVQCVSSNGYYALLAKRALGLPLVTTAQGELTMDANQLYRRSAFMNDILRQLLAESDFITACSCATLKELEDYSKIAFGSRARVVYNGIRCADFEKQAPYLHPRPYILGIGRLVPQKGFDVLIRAFAEAQLPSHDLLIAGEGSERDLLVQLARDMGVNDRVTLLGRADRPMAVSLFRGCDFFVLPSRMEPFGIVNLEAMAAGKAVVATRVGGVPEIVLDGQTGLLVLGGDVQALAIELRRLVNAPELRDTLGSSGQAFARKYDWEVIADQYIEVYERVIATASDRTHQLN